MTDLGYTFIYKFGNYCWKTCEFDFLEEDGMYQKSESGVSLYAKISGLLNCLCDESEINSHCVKELGEQFAMEDGNGFIHVFNNETSYLTKINIKKTSYYAGHIGSYITSYCRISNIKAMLEYDYDNIICFKLDSFVVNIDKPLQKNFIYKNETIKIIHENHIDGLFMNDIEPPTIIEDHVQYHDQVQFLVGAGGHGKTHGVLSTNKKVLFASRMWRLSAKKAHDYNTIGITINHLIGMAGDGKKGNSYLTKHMPPSKVFIDEVNQIDKSWIHKAIDLYPYSQVFLTGDLVYDKEENKFDYYQCPFPKVEVIDAIEDAGYREFTVNYRVKDDFKLLENLKLIRTKMKEFNFDYKRINPYVIKMYYDKFVSYNEVKSNYDYKNDYILSSTNVQNDKITTEINANKWKCVRHSADDIIKKIQGVPNVYLQGEYMIDPVDTPDIKKWQQKDSDTIHSCQGITIEYPSKLYINVSRMFCPRQMYTAISRVEHSDQLVFFRME